MQTQILSFASGVLTNYIDNAHVAPTSTDTLPVTNPSTGGKYLLPELIRAPAEELASVSCAGKQDVEFALASCKRALTGWSALTIKSRVQILLRFHALVQKHASELAEVCMFRVSRHGIDSCIYRSSTRSTARPWEKPWARFKRAARRSSTLYPCPSWPRYASAVITPLWM